MILPPENSEDPNQEEQESGFEVEDIEEMLADNSRAKRASKIRAYLIIAAVVAFFAILIFLLVFTLKSGFVPSDRSAETLKTSAGAVKSVEQKLDVQDEIKKFKSVRELEEYLQANSSQGYYGYYGMNYMLEGDVMNSVPLPSSTGMGGWSTDREMSTSGITEEKGDDFSQTNVQVEGVDEADIIKTDGEYVYALSANKLFLVRAYPAGLANVTSTIEFSDQPLDIYLDGDVLAVFGTDQQIKNEDIYKNFRRHSTYSFFKVYDISDKKNPRLVRDLSFEGSYQNSRMIGDYVYFLTRTPANFIEGEIPVPRILEDNKEFFQYSAQDSTCKDCPEVFYADVAEPGMEMVNISAIDLKRPDKQPTSQVYLLPGAQNLYVSLENIFLTYTKHLNENDLALQVMAEFLGPQLSSRNQEKIERIGNIESSILSPAEKQVKVTSVYLQHIESLPQEQRKELEKNMEDRMRELYRQLEKQIETTAIHKIQIKGNKLKYQGFGQVNGSVLNQFSMDESEGYFRIATTKNRNWTSLARDEDSAGQSYNNIFVLDDEMNVVGALEKLARDERIYSARFMQNRVYLVTFEQTDPLFVIDLENPSDPKMLGKLKVPGFSNYLHPYDENLLIGLGKETQATRSGGFVTKGLKLSLFNVENVNSPVEVDKFVFEDDSSNSIARNDHRAFLFSKEKNLLSIPVSMYEYSNNRDDATRRIFRGAYVFGVDPNGFTFKGTVEHTEGTRIDKRLAWCGEGCYSSTVRRSLYIKDMLYTFSDNYLKINALENLAPAGTIELQ